MCDFFNYVKYESNLKVVHLFNNGFQILALLEITDKIDYCMIGLNGEFIIIAGQTIFQQLMKDFYKIENQIIYAAYIFEIPIIVIQKKNQICVFSIRYSITEDYCVQSKQAGKVIEFGKTLRQKGKGVDNQKIKNNIFEQPFGLKQQICFLTTYNTLLCYDTKELRLLQKLQINNLDQTYKLVALHRIDLNLVKNYDSKIGSKNHILFYYSYQKMKLQTFIFDLSLGSIQLVASRRCKNIV
ncbi:unnamed protein product (macronuclear) [Paramecium tetraurelia]|uniref:Uncharacterized protein n=1 Tax=Paramecium tetraurelia TaxID=5888 RepID=A0E6E9_PARTE|nr:uncharacterized protein GSPATT00003731001 [Paramecium tetraurelia]CAK90866.1 unnamed protein product [Paramecium tetraurelia]|eukprot:XP_001458263.1 hypothetical protein (macronuclear) [Paramecium tetraurelia strain d4-2]